MRANSQLQLMCRWSGLILELQTPIRCSLEPLFKADVFYESLVNTANNCVEGISVESFALTVCCFRHFFPSSSFHYPLNSSISATRAVTVTDALVGAHRIEKDGCTKSRTSKQNIDLTHLLNSHAHNHHYMLPVCVCEHNHAHSHTHTLNNPYEYIDQTSPCSSSMYWKWRVNVALCACPSVSMYLGSTAFRCFERLSLDLWLCLSLMANERVAFCLNVRNTRELTAVRYCAKHTTKFAKYFFSLFVRITVEKSG